MTYVLCTYHVESAGVRPDNPGSISVIPAKNPLLTVEVFPKDAPEFTWI